MSDTIDFIPAESAVQSADARLSKQDWAAFADEMNGYGCAVLPGVLTPDECATLAADYPESAPFRSHIHMARHGFGKGEYKYYRYPLPDLIGGLRTALYPHLAEVANAWNTRMGIAKSYPAAHADFLRECHAEGQLRPTPLLLQSHILQVSR